MSFNDAAGICDPGAVIVNVTEFPPTDNKKPERPLGFLRFCPALLTFVVPAFLRQLGGPRQQILQQRWVAPKIHGRHGAENVGQVMVYIQMVGLGCFHNAANNGAGRDSLLGIRK